MVDELHASPLQSIRPYLILAVPPFLLDSSSLARRARVEVCPWIEQESVTCYLDLDEACDLSTEGGSLSQCARDEPSSRCECGQRRPVLELLPSPATFDYVSIVRQTFITASRGPS